MKKISFIIVLCLWTVYGMAQNPVRERMEAKRAEIEKAKKEFISDRINLKADQEEAFWTIYDEYVRNKMRIKRQMMRIRKHSYTLTTSEEELKEAVDRTFALKEEELALEKSNRDKLLEVINVRQLVELYRSEKEFLVELIRILRNR